MPIGNLEALSPFEEPEEARIEEDILAFEERHGYKLTDEQRETVYFYRKRGKQ